MDKNSHEVSNSETSSSIFDNFSSFLTSLNCKLNLFSSKGKYSNIDLALLLNLLFNFMQFLVTCQNENIIIRLFSFVSLTISGFLYFSIDFQIRFDPGQILLIQFLLQAAASILADQSLDITKHIIIWVFKENQVKNERNRLKFICYCFSMLVIKYQNLLFLILEISIVLFTFFTINSLKQDQIVIEDEDEDEGKYFSDINLSSPFSTIMENINFSLKILDELKNDQNISILKTSLSLIKHLLNENPNIHSPSIEKITKDLDIEDKIFIEQTTLEIKIHEFSISSPVRLPHPDHSPLSTDKLQVLLKNIGKDWHFNTLFIADLSENNPLYTCGEYVFKYLNFTQHFHIPGKILENFLKITESRYLNNPYHNSCHAADVMNSFMYLIHPVMRFVPSTEMISCVISCLGHDLKHPGRNNRFLIQTKDKLAYVYNDSSVLENMHACEVFNILNEDEANVVSLVEDFDYFRKIVIELILSTDMAKHFEFLAGMNLFRMNIEELMSTSSGRLAVFKVMIKSADIGHTSKILNVHKKWCSLIIEEFFTQGDEEKKRNLSVSMYCDRNNTDISKSQSGFLKNIALPLFIALHKIMGSTDHHQECISQLKSNISYWENKRDKDKFISYSKRIETGRTYTFTKNNDDKYNFDTKRKAFIRNFD